MKSYLNASDREILNRAILLLETSLRNFHGPKSDEVIKQLRINPRDKGKLGNLVEVLHFGLTLNQRPGPDFVRAGIELKTTGMKTLQTGQLVAKERLPLGMIDYMRYKDPAQWDFETGGILQKSRILLLMVYLYEKNVEIVDLLFKLIDFWKIPETDLEIIKQDWEHIVGKIRGGRAEDLSEGDTFYLGASTAGAGHGRKRQQPFSNKTAKPRKFSLKPPYLDHMLAVLSGKDGKKYGRIITDSSILTGNRTLEQIVVAEFQRFIGKTPNEITDALGVSRLNSSSKSFAAQITKAVLRINLSKKIEEFEKAGIIVRTVRLQPSELPRESVSFPAFHFTDLVNETWEESSFKAILDSKFFFVFFQYEGNRLVLRRVRFWNMPVTDIAEAKKVWKQTVELVRIGRIFKCSQKQKNGTIRRLTHFPDKGDNPVSHVRPHGGDALDTYPLPVPDQLTGAMSYTKQCFWINNDYVRDSIYRT